MNIDNKNFQQMLAKLNPTVYKENYVSRQSEIYSMYANLFQQLKIN